MRVAQGIGPAAMQGIPRPNAAAQPWPGVTANAGAAEAARREAFLILKGMMPDRNAEAIKTVWLDLVKRRFGARPQIEITVAEWTAFKGNISQYRGEEAPPVPTQDDVPPAISQDDIPF